MDGIIFLIVLIVLYNLFSILMKAMKNRKSPPVSGRASVGERVGLSEPGEIPESVDRYNLFPREEAAGEEINQRTPYGEWVYDEEDEDADEPANGDFGKRVVMPEEQSSGEETELPDKEIKESPAFPGSLRQVLSDKDSLVAAIVFHELIGTPVSMRKRR
ncbi:MAG: hypothetical protein AVO34_04420 [Firmicutes bacterium ML8_F2]|jgi:hypothetical protein|nr:MAG: hypothetical protein AVO34_04420 [Firmicutes bacterium ML8_F2]